MVNPAVHPIARSGSCTAGQALKVLRVLRQPAECGMGSHEVAVSLLNLPFQAGYHAVPLRQLLAQLIPGVSELIIHL